MTQFRVIHNKDNPYLTINTTIAEDDRLSWRAKGIWLYAFSRKDDWQFRFSDLQKRSTEGRDALRKALKELEKNGYLHRRVRQTDKGKLDGQEWSFFETSRSGEEIKKQLRVTEKPSDGKAVGRENRPTVDHPLTINEDIVSNEEEVSKKEYMSAETSDVCNSLFSFLKNKNPKFEIKSKSAWEKNTKKLLKQYSKEEISEVIEWTFTADNKNAEFWQTVIQSPESLYKNIDQMIIQMNHKSKAEKQKDQEKTKSGVAKENKKWAEKTIGPVDFPDLQQRITLCDNCVWIKNYRENFPVGYAQPNFKNIILNKLKSWNIKT